ncbi:TetR/AcrR family transcriptional regulator [Brachybacterium sp. EF45031]|uniref:TetR/AcrR family transcriptional regulator n=1 Tax=Brachybacterium sillae TaxID=2810536 RepID=UPI00217CFD0E|nr:TetR/AcrR family transcriptional regulator [Brachybacterium sillae]MCS6711926.1 TetR/AcrR family transcriptional regulator [Brachybacterium sillae]
MTPEITAHTRDDARSSTRARLLAAARDQLAAGGASAVSTRAAARTAGVVSSAVFRHFPTREALLTALTHEAISALNAHVGAATCGDDGPDAWRRAAVALRDWALAHPHEFHLLVGTPVPGALQAIDTTPTLLTLAEPFLDAVRTARPAPVPAPVAQDMAELQREHPFTPPAALALALGGLAQVIGLLLLELRGYDQGLLDRPDGFYAAVVEQQISALAFR